MKLGLAILQSVLIWFMTCAIGSAFHAATGTIGLYFYEIFILSLIFSLPALVLLIPNFYILSSVIGKIYKIIYAFVSVFILSGLVLITFIAITRGFPFEDGLMKAIILPYVLAALLSFFAIANKCILTQSTESINKMI